MSTDGMEVRVLLFARGREVCGVDALDLTLPPGSTVAEAFSRLAAAHPGLGELRDRFLVAVNQRYAAWDRPLEGGDELALIPPVSGG